MDVAGADSFCAPPENGRLSQEDAAPRTQARSGEKHGLERDLIAEGGGYGNEVKFGGGKVIRDGMGQSPTATDAESLDLVLTNALILEAALGIIKADIGIPSTAKALVAVTRRTSFAFAAS